MNWSHLGGKGDHGKFANDRVRGNKMDRAMNAFASAPPLMMSN